MKKRMGVLLLIIMMSVLAACNGSGGDAKAPQATGGLDKDASMLLKALGDSKSMVESLGDLPEAQANGNLFYYQNAGTEGYYAGFDLGVETEADGDRVKQIYIQPIGDSKITANGLVIGGSIVDAKTALGEGILTSAENNGSIVNFMTFTDEAYVMKATVEDKRITAVAFTLNESTDLQSGDEKPSASDAPSVEKPAGENSHASANEGAADTQAPVKTDDSSSAAGDSGIPNEELAHAFDWLMDFLDRDYADAEEALGDEYLWDRELYGGSAIIVGDILTTSLGEDLDSGLATHVMIAYTDPQADNEPMGMAGFLLGAEAKGDSLSGIPYGDYTIYVLRDGSDQISGIQAIRTTPLPVPTIDAYQLSIEQFDTYSILNLVYEAGGEKVELVNTDGRWDGDQFFDGMDAKILKAKQSRDGRYVYFETDDPKMTSGYGAANNTILKYDVAGQTEENLCLGFLYDTVKLEGYEDCLIISYYQPDPSGGYYQPYMLVDGEANYHFMGTELETDLAGQIRRAYHDEIDQYAMAAPENETIYGQYVDFSAYHAVVVEDYQGINGDDFVNKMTIENPYYKDTAESLYPNILAVFGTIYNVRWEVGINWEESETYFLADEWTDAYITYMTWRPGDPSTDIFLFQDKNGKEYRVAIEDCSDNIDLVMVP